MVLKYVTFAFAEKELISQKRVFVKVQGQAVTFDDVCDRSEPYPIGTFNTLINEGTGVVM